MPFCSINHKEKFKKVFCRADLLTDYKDHIPLTDSSKHGWNSPSLNIVTELFPTSIPGCQQFLCQAHGRHLHEKLSKVLCRTLPYDLVGVIIGNNDYKNIKFNMISDPG